MNEQVKIKLTKSLTPPSRRGMGASSSGIMVLLSPIWPPSETPNLFTI